MSNEIAIRVENLGKCYRIGLKDKAHDTFGGMLMSWLKSPLSSFRRVRSLTQFKDIDEGDESFLPEDIVWALRGISFEVKRGEVLGIIGPNGSGKSTLLKILSRVTELTSGRVDIHGRIGSLLEVGTGFHPELSGRDNVYLNGSILGMTKKEIDSKFDEIVEFSGVEKFMDTPVKRYSSGMRVRLAFAVAAHLDPEILLVDEVLAVGDASFRKKCIDKMGDIAREGRTILFVSHNLSAVSQLCNRGLLLEAGQVVAHGPIGEVIAQYNTQLVTAREDKRLDCEERVTVREYRRISNGVDIAPSTPSAFSFRATIREACWQMSIVFIIKTVDGTNLVLESIDSEQYPELLCPGSYKIEVLLPALWLQPNVYSSRIKVVAHPADGETERYYSDWLHIDVGEPDSSGHGVPRILAPSSSWQIQAVADK